MEWAIAGMVSVVAGLVGPGLSSFDTPMERFTRCSCGPGCADRDRAVSLSLAAAQRVVRMVPVREVGEWWWFENSRAYLYYFFIVNDCQFIVRSLRVAGRP